MILFSTNFIIFFSRCQHQPWEASQTQNSSSSFIQSQGSGDASSYGFQDNNQFNGSSSTPWWQRKNARITEIESEDEQKFGSSGVPINERPVPRSWVPPQPPPVAMAEAAAAIRQPKKSSLQKDQLTDDQLLERTSEISDELQRITKISESGGVAEANGVTSGDSMTQTPLAADGMAALE